MKLLLCLVLLVIAAISMGACEKIAGGLDPGYGWKRAFTKPHVSGDDVPTGAYSIGGSPGS